MVPPISRIQTRVPYFNAETAVSSEPTLRLKAQAKKEITEVELEISSTEVKDSAVYYCALCPQ